MTGEYQNRTRGRTLVSRGSGFGAEAGSREKSNKLSGSINAGEL
jgi:hypothetical protein